MKMHSRIWRTILEYTKGKGGRFHCHQIVSVMRKKILTLGTQEVDKDIPSSYAEALKNADAGDWLKACGFENNSLSRLETRDLLEAPENRKKIRTKWVFEIKRERKGKVIRRQVQLVVKTFLRVTGAELKELFSPVLMYSRVRVVCALAFHFGWKESLIDVKNAFVNALRKESN